MIDPGRAPRGLLSLPALLAGLLLPSVCQATLVGPGDLAFVGFKSDGIDEFAIVLLADADVGQFVSFNNSSYDSVQGRFGANRNHFLWEVTDALSAGTVVTFNRLSVTNPTSSSGILRAYAGSEPAETYVMQLQQGGDTLYAYLGLDRVPEAFLGAISTVSATFDETGLINGDTAIYLPPASGVVTEGHYVGPRDTESAFADYRSLIANVSANWERRSLSTGSVSEFDSSNFTLQNGASVPESPAVIMVGVLMLLACLSLGARWRRQPAIALADSQS